MTKRMLVLVALVVFGLAALAYSQGEKQVADVKTKASVSEAAPDSASAVADTAQTHKIVAYYFHGNVRCVSCKKIEAYTGEAIQSGFAKDLDNGALEWRVVNIDEPENKHFIEDYQLYTKSVILSDMADGKEVRWKNLDKVWKLLGDKDEFIAYIDKEVKGYLGAD